MILSTSGENPYMNAHMSDADLSDLIQPYEQAIAEAVLKGWKQWLEVPDRAQFYNRTRANVVWNYTVRALEAALDPLPGTHVNRAGNTCIFMIGQQLAFRFKKGDERGFSSNYPTPLALAFHDPEQHVLGIPEAVKTEIIYILNKLETEIYQVRMVRRNGDSVIWSHPIYERQVAGIETIPTRQTAMPSKDSQIAEPARKRRATVKKELAPAKLNEIKPSRPSS
jgi:hypothetical protein